ncbi:MAG TPA: ABC transporter permease [Terriglobia bacterium]|nr:ABC transporter permease [Terriglobia bacterium]
MRHLPLILKNCWRNRRRTILTVLSMGVSICLLGVLLAIYHALFAVQPTEWGALRLVTRNRVSLTLPLPQGYREKIEQVPGVKVVGIEQWFGGKYIDDRPEHMFARFAAEPDKLFLYRGELTIPEDQKRAFQQDRSACIASRSLADKLGWKLGDRITLIGDIFPGNFEFTLKGIFDDPTHFEALYFSREDLEQSMSPRRRGNAGTFDILVDSKEDVPQVEKAVDDMFHNAPVQTKTESESAFFLSFVSFLGNIKLFLMSICAAVTFTILLVSANTIAMSVRERVREVGVLKALGYTRNIILGLILGEATVIATCGGVVGLLLASGLAGAVRNMPGVNFFPQFKNLTIVPPVAALCLLLAACIGLASSFIPALGASRISIVDALRSTE